MNFVKHEYQDLHSLKCWINSQIYSLEENYTRVPVLSPRARVDDYN